MTVAYSGFFRCFPLYELDISVVVSFQLQVSTLAFFPAPSNSRTKTSSGASTTGIHYEERALKVDKQDEDGFRYVSDDFEEESDWGDDSDSSYDHWPPHVTESIRSLTLQQYADNKTARCSFYTLRRTSYTDSGDEAVIVITLSQWDLERFGARNGAVDWKEGREPHLRRRRRGWGAPPASYLSVVGVWRMLHTFGSLGWNFRKEHRKLCG